MNILGKARLEACHKNLSQTNLTVEAASYGCWRITYTVGSYGIDSGGQLKLVWRIVSDWGRPQFDDPEAENYTTVHTTGAAKIHLSYSDKAYTRPFLRGIILDIFDGSLAPGDEVVIVLGDGGLGMRAQTYLESAFEFKLLVDPTNSCDPRPIDDKLYLQVVAAAPAQLSAIIPSQAQVGESFEVFVKAEDTWRNPTHKPEYMDFQWHGSGELVFEGSTASVVAPGSGYISVSTEGMSCKSNPIELLSEPRVQQRFWGDLHAQTAETVGVGSEDEYFRFARDWAKLDFCSHQGNDFQMSECYWQELNRCTRAFNQENHFVVFPGYEWSGGSPTGGDHNVFYKSEGRPILRSSHWLVPEEAVSKYSPAHPADIFYAKMKEAVPLDEVIVCQHVGGRYANLLEYFDRELIRLVEIVSVWGVFEWMLWDAIEQGHMVGVMANSDGHHGRPGAEGPGLSDFGIANGLTCVFAERLAREEIFEALKQRRCYATTGERMLLSAHANGHPMGSIVPLPQEEVEVMAKVESAGALESLQLYQNTELITEVRAPEFYDLSNSSRIRISWQGCRERGRQRRVVWDGSIRTKGCKILSAKTFAFDVVADGINEQSEDCIVFRSRTTGDRDGVDLLLDNAFQGHVIFASAVGVLELDLSKLQAKKVFPQGGIDMQVTIERYPKQHSQRSLELHAILPSPKERTAYTVKATQVDGHMAWASPVWFD